MDRRLRQWSGAVLRRAIIEEHRKMKKPASLVASIVLGLIALAQLLRVLFRVEVKAGGIDIPLWPSVFAVIVFGALGIWLWRERRGQE